MPGSADERLAGLSRSYLFEGLTLEELRPLAAVATTRELVRGEYVWHAGDHAAELYVVLRGEVRRALPALSPPPAFNGAASGRSSRRPP